MSDEDETLNDLKSLIRTVCAYSSKENLKRF